MTGIIGKKIGMTQIFDEAGDKVVVTVVETGPCYVLQKKTIEKEGYDAIQLGFVEEKKKKNVTRPLQKHFEKAKSPIMKIIKEFKVDYDSFDPELGKEIKVEEIFEPGNMVKVSGTSKGKGFAGVIKRHNFGGAPGSRGTHEAFRHGGSIGMASYPGRVLKGKKMPGRMGCDRVTVKNLKIVNVIKEKNLVLIRGAVPGFNGSVLTINKI